jgi:hypothetical protein
MASSVRRRQLGPFAVRSTEILIAEGGEEGHTLRRSALPLLVVPRSGHDDGA